MSSAPHEPRTDIGLTVEEMDLARRASLKTSGADVHEVNKTIHTLYLASDRLQKQPDHAGALAWRDMATRQLRAFLYHGDIHKAIRDIPLVAWSTKETSNG